MKPELNGVLFPAAQHSVLEGDMQAIVEKSHQQSSPAMNVVYYHTELLDLPIVTELKQDNRRRNDQIRGPTMGGNASWELSAWSKAHA